MLAIYTDMGASDKADRLIHVIDTVSPCVAQSGAELRDAQDPDSRRVGQLCDSPQCWDSLSPKESQVLENDERMMIIKIVFV